MDKLDVLVVGGGGREYAICKKLNESPRLNKLYCLPGNGGIAAFAECAPIKTTDIKGIVAFALEKNVNFAVVASDDPLALGCVDALEAAGVRAFGPVKDAAVIESSKVFSKGLMRKYNIPTARWEAFSDMKSALEYLDKQSLPIVIKCDGLALGKGVVIADTRAKAEETLDEMLNGSRHGEAGRRVVIEEFMEGREVTVLTFCDGETLITMPPSRDHKRAFDGDTGDNTGGMGVICPVSDYTPEHMERAMNEIFLPTIKAMAAEGRTFKGVLYFGLMLTANGPKVVEYNARFGDPEAQAVLALLESDLLEIFIAVRDGKLKEITPCWKDSASAVIVLASGGYPGASEQGFPIRGLDDLPDGVHICHAGTALRGGTYVTSGGRVLNLCAVSGNLESALELAYSSVNRVSFEGMRYRTDIGGFVPH